MSISFQAKNESVLGAQLKVQTLKLPFVITGNATPASVVVGRDDPSILFIKTEGVDQITAALDTDDTAPTYEAATDSTGVFNILVKFYGEPIKKVVSAKITRIGSAAEVYACTLPSAPSDGVVAGGSLDKIALNADSASAFTSGSHICCLELDYVVNES